MTDNNLIGHEVKAAPCAPPCPEFLDLVSNTNTHAARTYAHARGH
jgi:hypothetical protein